jgi:hypothetical protein
MRRSLLLFLAFLLVTATALAHGSHSSRRSRSVSIDDDDRIADCSAMRVEFDGNRVPVVTEEVAVGNLRSLRVRSDRNGGVRVFGSTASRFSVKACKAVSLNGDAAQIRVALNGDEVSVDGPDNDDWVVYFIVETPRNATLDVSSTNGPIGIVDFNGTLTARAKNGPLSVKDSSGTIDASTVNGPISIDGGSGKVKLTATNGPLSVKLDGSSWDGDLDASTQNGPLSLRLPRGYRSGVVVESLGHGPVSCRAERCTETRVRDDDDDRLRRIELGSGPTTVRLSTVNGPVSVKDRD